MDEQEKYFLRIFIMHFNEYFLIIKVKLLIKKTTNILKEIPSFFKINNTIFILTFSMIVELFKTSYRSEFI